MRLQNLEILRFIAAIWVVVAHTAGALEARGQEVPFSDVFGFGGAGVDLFFVLSGFVIGFTQLQSPKTLGSFVRARLIRIVPAYWVVTTTTLIVVGALALTGRHFPAFSGLSIEWILSSFGFVSLLAGFENPVVYVGWTLEFEMLFYSLFALAIVFVRHPGRQLMVASALLVLLAVVEPGSLTQFEFTLGLLVAFLSKRFSIGIPIAVISTLTGLYTLWLLAGTATLELPAVVTKGIPFALIVFGMANLKQVKSQFAIRLGQSSYAVYLVQVLSIPAILELSSLWPQVPTLLTLATIALATQIVGMAFEEVWDSRVRSFLQRRLQRRGPK